MKDVSLNGIWTLSCGERLSLPCKVPGTAGEVLLNNGLMPDPYTLDHEAICEKALDQDFLFERTFLVRNEDLAYDRIDLCCKGLDTICSIAINGLEIGRADNMHRTWTFDVKDVLVSGENKISIQFISPIRYLKEHPSLTGKKYSVIRKAACMYGWDWSLSFPDTGIWRDISLQYYRCGKIRNIVVSQKHTDNLAVLEPEINLDLWEEGLVLSVCLSDPDGKEIHSKQFPAVSGKVSFPVSSPQLWWPAGYGDQPLYTLTAELKDGSTVLDRCEKRIGLRTIELDRAETDDPYSSSGKGRKYSFIVNSIPVFIKGESMIIQDAFLSKSTPDRWKDLVDQAANSNLNCIRVWGGAYYPPDEFFDACDAKGILVYEDLMFACTFYAPTPEMTENATKEVEDNVCRIAHHASLALLCGNNEIDVIYTTMTSEEKRTTALRRLFGGGDLLPEETRKKLKMAYHAWFVTLFREICQRYAPDTCYVNGSPEGEGPFMSNSILDYLSTGDMHYYLQYDGNLPYQTMEEMHSRFISELGFQSYPDMQTIRAFASPENMKPDSSIMLSHQKCAGGNEAIELYMRREYGVPRNFEHYVFLSQMTASRIMQFSIEHFRRESDYCRGLILWQLNDCWPVVSWSGIDYFGRWKAEQYMIRRTFAPVIISCKEESEKLVFWLCNQSNQSAEGEIEVTIIDSEDGTVEIIRHQAKIAGDSSEPCFTINQADWIHKIGKERLVFIARFISGGMIISEISFQLVPSKQLVLNRQEIDWSVLETDDLFEIRLVSDSYIQAASLWLTEGEAIFEENNVDLIPGQVRTIALYKEKTNLDLPLLKKNLRIISVNEVLA